MNFLRRNRWRVLLLIAFVSVVIVWAIQVRGWHITHPARDIIFAAGLINLFVFCWLRVCSGMSVAKQTVFVITIVSVQAIFLSQLRIDGYHGDGRILTKWKWQPLPQERLEEFVDASNVQPVQGLTAPDFASPQVNDAPRFRGANGSGQYLVDGMTTDWELTPPRELWRRPIGQGWSSFAAVGDHCVTQEIRKGKETVVCYHIDTGQEVWKRPIDETFEEVTSGAGSRSTPTISDGNVYAFSGLGKLSCLRGTDGEPIWVRDLRDPNAEPILFGFCGSPLVHGEYIYIMLGGSHGSLVAVNRTTGEVVWKTGERRGSYSSPVLLDLGGQHAVIIHDAVGMFAYEITSGKQLCKFDWGRDSEEQVNACQPAIVDKNHILLSSGYGVGSVLVRLQRQDDEVWNATEVWRTIQLKSKFQSLLVRDGFVYGLDEGILTCIDLETGERTWKKGRYGYGQLIMVNDTLTIQSESGDITIVAVNPKRYQPIATINALTDRTWNHPVVSRGSLLVRNDREAICFELPTM